MIKSFFGTIIVVALLTACHSQKNSTDLSSTTEQNWKQDTVVISFERTACFGKCPTFKADLYGDGKVLYHGINNVENKGHYQGEVDADQLEALYKKAEAIAFFQMNDKYDGNITDVPSQIYFIEMYGKKKKIYARYKTPLALNDFGTMIDGVLNGIKWKPIEGAND